MSHFTKCALKMTNLAALKKALADMKLQVHRGRAGPVGRPCAAIAATRSRPRSRSTWAATTSASSRTSDGTYDLTADWWGVETTKGVTEEEFKHQLSPAVPVSQREQACEEKGYAVEEEVNEEDGSIRLVVRKWVAERMSAKQGHRDRHHAKGEVTFKVKGMKGGSCLDETKFLEQALGGDAAVVDQQKTGEFYEQSEGYVSTWAGEGKDE